MGVFQCGFMNLYCAVFLINLIRYLTKATPQRGFTLVSHVGSIYSIMARKAYFWEQMNILMSAKVAGGSMAKPESRELDQSKRVV